MISRGLAIINDPQLTQSMEYRNLVDGNPMVLYYANPCYLEMLKKITGGKLLLVSMIEDGRMIAAIPVIYKEGKYGKVFNFLPFWGSNPGIIWDRNILPPRARLIAKHLIEVFWQMTATSFSTTLIGNPFDPFLDLYDITDEVGSDFIVYQTPRIGMMTPIINDEKLLMDSFHQKTRNMIRKGQKSATAVHWSPIFIPEIQKIHQENMATIGAPAKPDSLFDWLLTMPEGLNVYALECQNEIAAGLILLRQKSIVEYFMPVIRKEFRHLAPLNFLIFKAMIDQAKQGSTFWNWGGTSLPSQQGVYRFKSRFGAIEGGYKYHTRIKGVDARLTRAEIEREYPYFYVIPFDQLPTSNDFYGEEAE